MLHRTAKLTPFGRRLLVDRVLIEGWPAAMAAEMLGVSRATAYKWLRGTGPKARSGSRTARRGRSIGHGHWPAVRSTGSWSHGGGCESGRIGWARSSVIPARRCTASYAAMA